MKPSAMSDPKRPCCRLGCKARKRHPWMSSRYFTVLRDWSHSLSLEIWWDSRYRCCLPDGGLRDWRHLPASKEIYRAYWQGEMNCCFRVRHKRRICRTSLAVKPAISAASFGFVPELVFITNHWLVISPPVPLSTPKKSAVGLSSEPNWSCRYHFPASGTYSLRDKPHLVELAQTRKGMFRRSSLPPMK